MFSSASSLLFIHSLHWWCYFQSRLQPYIPNPTHIPNFPQLAATSQLLQYRHNWLSIYSFTIWNFSLLATSMSKVQTKRQYRQWELTQNGKISTYFTSPTHETLIWITNSVRTSSLNSLYRISKPRNGSRWNKPNNSWKVKTHIGMFACFWEMIFFVFTESFELSGIERGFNSKVP